ncbi:MAG: FAD-binding oxidoreductase [Thermoleophilaceae bacterium]|nr:FAD-binding oxidoreductase [Thermoleophilaceae bacterium]
MATPQRPTERVPYLDWSLWGVAGEAEPLPEDRRTLIRQALGAELDGPAVVPVESVELPPSRLTPEQLLAVGQVVGEQNISRESAVRLVHCMGKSTPDLLRARTGAVDAAPDAVVLPATHDEVEKLLAVCSRHAIAVVPFGGGSSVVGGLDPLAGSCSAVISLDLRRLDRLVALDPISQTATLEAGLRGPEAEALLGAQGFMLGHYPQSFPYATIGGFAATRSSGQASAGYGRFDAMVVALKVATPTGTLELGRSPSNAAGPDLRQLFLGSEGVLGVITEVTMHVLPVPAARRYEAFQLPDFRSGVEAVRRLKQEDAVPTVLRLSDELETFITGGQSTAPGAAIEGDEGELVDIEAPPLGGCLLLTGFEGSAQKVADTRARAAAILAECGATELGPEIGEGWLEHRFEAPYLRDQLLDAGVLTETFETVTGWSDLIDLYEELKDAVSESLVGVGNALVWCHVSHVYATGASLYFTVAAPLGENPLERWLAAKRVAGDKIAGSGASITHHHAVGADHAPWMVDEIGPLGIGVLRAVKRQLDPAGIMNPGKLIDG